MGVDKKLVFKGVLNFLLVANFVLSVTQVAYSYIRSDIECFSVMEPLTWLMMRGTIGILCSIGLISYQHFGNGDYSENSCIKCLLITYMSAELILIILGSTMFFHACTNIQYSDINKLILTSLIFDYTFTAFMLLLYLFARHLTSVPYRGSYEQL